jgi:hypothetical protein
MQPVHDIPEILQRRYHCAVCHHRAPAPGTCPRCPEEPLLDLADPEVRIMLEQQDDAHKWRHAGKVIGISAGAAVPLTVGIMTAAEMAGMEGLNVIQVMFGTSLAVMFGLFAIWKPHKSAPKLQDEELAALEVARE